MKRKRREEKRESKRRERNERKAEEGKREKEGGLGTAETCGRWVAT